MNRVGARSITVTATACLALLVGAAWVITVAASHGGRHTAQAQQTIPVG